MGNYFSFEILAPEGLAGIEPALAQYGLSLEARASENDGRVILFAPDSSNFDWSMVISNDRKWSKYLFGGGEFYEGIEHAEAFLQSLSHAFEQSGFPHKIMLDDEDSTLVRTYESKWVDRDLS